MQGECDRRSRCAAEVLSRGDPLGDPGKVDHESEEKTIPMKKDLKVGDHVGWNSEAGHVRGTITKKITSAITFKGYTVHASKEEPQYLIKSDTTDHLAMHKGSALKKLQK
jgi:hypothetical protein